MFANLCEKRFGIEVDMAKIKKPVKMADIAERLGVSTVTVSKALSGQRGVSEEVRDKIIMLADKMGYKAPATQKKERPSSLNIGVIISNRYLAEYESFYWKLYQEVAAKGMQKECFILFLPRLLAEKKADGLIVIGKPGYNYAEFLKEVAGIPLVFLDFYETDASVDCFISDGFYGTYVLTNYLIERGHTDIAYVGTLFATESITDRYLGYVKALMEHGITPTSEYLIKDRDIESGMRDGYSLDEFPASLIIKALQDRGYSVPDDVSVVGYDDFLYPGLCDVDITTYAVDIKEMAKGAVNTLIKKISGESYKKGIHVVEGHMVEKASVADRR